VVVELKVSQPSSPEDHDARAPHDPRSHYPPWRGSRCGEGPDPGQRTLESAPAAVVALALVAQATRFGENFRFFALLILPVLVVVGLATFLRLVDLNNEDVGLVAGMNRLRRGYLDLWPS
jgi:hypothetical protein